MQQDRAKALLLAYHLDQSMWRQFSSHNDLTGQYLIDNHAQFSFIADVVKLRTLATFIGQGDGHLHGFPRATLLIKLMRIAGKQLDIIPNGNPFLNNVTLVNGLNDILDDWSVPRITQLTAFIQARMNAAPGQHATKIVADVIPIANFVGVTEEDKLKIFDLVRSAGDKCTLNVKTSNIKTLVRLHTQLPDGKFGGFTRWGPGDSLDNNAATNLANHFKKHVCNSSGDFLVDATWWWRALEIKVTAVDLVHPNPTAAELLYFTGPGGIQDPRRIGDFITHVVRVRDNLIDAIYAAWGHRYRDYAIKLSKELEGIVVEAADKVMIGGYTGHVGIFGRYDDADDIHSELGISSCYFVEKDQRGAKITTDKPTTLWTMTKA